jgi:hypothetical protein
VVVDHRHRVEELIPLLDVVIWVVDPEKYRDAALHDRYLRPLAGYAAQFLFALNQTDRIHPESVAVVADDLARALADDGIEPSHVITVAASPAVGPPIGVEALRGHLDGLTRSTLFGKLLVDLSAAASRLLDALGPSVDYRDRAGDVVEDAVGLLSEGEVVAAADSLCGFLDRLAQEVGPEVGERIMETADRVHVGLASVALPEATRASWWQRVRGVAPEAVDRETPARGAVTDLLRPVEEIMSIRARAIALTTDLSISVAAAQSVL